MAREFSRRRFKIAPSTVYEIYKRDGWRSIRKRASPILTEEHTKQRKE